GLLALHPRLKIDLTLDDRVLDVVSEGFDISLRIRATLPDSSLIARRLGGVEQVFCASPAYLAKRGTPRHAGELSAHDCLMYGLAQTGARWEVTGPDGPVRIAVSPRFTVNNGLMLADLLAADAGIGALPSFIAQPLLAEGRLTRVLADYAFAPRGIYAVYAGKRHLERKIGAFVDYLAGALPQH
ncbi:MAG TPA: substrate binding domain-containing protein, partial [Burkholderiaceae bacterium]